MHQIIDVTLLLSRFWRLKVLSVFFTRGQQCSLWQLYCSVFLITLFYHNYNAKRIIKIRENFTMKCFTLISSHCSYSGRIQEVRKRDVVTISISRLHLDIVIKRHERYFNNTPLSRPDPHPFYKHKTRSRTHPIPQNVNPPSPTHV